MADAADTGAKGAAAYDDRPIHAEPGQLPPEFVAPLAAFHGAEPPAPQWFKEAIAQEPERGIVTSLDTPLEVLTWGEIGKPGLLFVHGNGAHADWWSFVAPFFAGEFRVAAVSLAGMGASGWRDVYRFSDFAIDTETVARAAGLYEGGRKPVYVGHSFGGGQVLYTAVRHPGQMHAAILVDSGFGPPPEEIARRLGQSGGQSGGQAGGQPGDVRNIPTLDRASRVYPTVEAALARFRLMPQQPVGNPFVADFIARRSLKRAPLEDGSGEGWTWRFDPNMWTKLDRSQMTPDTFGSPRSSVPMVHIYGAQSAIITRRNAGQPSPFPPGTPEIEIPDSHHHIMVDQPLALVAAIRALLAVWPA